MSRAEGSTGSALMTVSHLGHSEFPIRMDTGAPVVTPCRTPARIETSSASNFWRVPRPYPRRRRAKTRRRSSVVMRKPEGRPSIVASNAGPCDSPAVIHLSMPPSVPQGRLPMPAHSHGVNDQDCGVVSPVVPKPGSVPRMSMTKHRVSSPAARSGGIVIAKREPTF